MLLYFQEAGPNMLHFIRKLKSIVPDMIVSQATYGVPLVLVNYNASSKDNHDVFLG